MTKPATRARSGSSVTSVPRMSGRSRRLRPLSCAAIMVTVRAAVATSPNSAQPAQSIAAQPLVSSAGRQLMRLGLQGMEHPGDGFVEAGHAGLLKRAPDVVHVDPDRGQAAQRLGRLVGAGVDGAGEPPVVLEG